MTVSFSGSYFGVQSWASVSAACDKFAAIEEPSVDDAINLVKFITGETYAAEAGDTAKIFLQRNMSGKEGVILINNQKHIVRCIDALHDQLATSTADNPQYATFTFELVTLLSGQNGAALKSTWNGVFSEQLTCKDYTNSTLRKNLTGEGEASGESVWSTPALSMLPNDLQSVIKTVNKKVATYNDASSAWVVSDNGYNDKLFALTYTEMAQPSSEYAKVEGTSYKFWSDNQQKEEAVRKGVLTRKDAQGTNTNYLLTSPYTYYDTDSVWRFESGSSVFEDTYTGVEQGISFAFCI